MSSSERPAKEIVLVYRYIFDPFPTAPTGLDYDLKRAGHPATAALRGRTHRGANQIAKNLDKPLTPIDNRV
jgi:hypothetical protein